MGELQRRSASRLLLVPPNPILDGIARCFAGIGPFTRSVPPGRAVSAICVRGRQNPTIGAEYSVRSVACSTGCAHVSSALHRPATASP